MPHEEPRRRHDLAALLCCLACSLLACDATEHRSASYRNYAAAVEDGAVTRGWVPEWVPPEALHLKETHDLDTNQVCLRLSLAEEPRSRLVEGLRQLRPREVEALSACSLNPPWWFEGLIEQQPANDNALYSFVYEAPESQWLPRGYIALDRNGSSVFAWSR